MLWTSKGILVQTDDGEEGHNCQQMEGCAVTTGLTFGSLCRTIIKGLSGIL